MTIAAFGLIAPLANASENCENIAVVSETAKYMILDGQTLETLDVGDLRWHGVWGIDWVMAGSTLARFAFVTDALSAEYAESDDSGHFQRSALVVVTDLTERAISHGYESSIWDALWIDGADQLIVWESSKARVAVLDERLEEVDAFSFTDWRTQATLACRRDGDLFIATGSRRTIRRNGESAVDGLATPDGFEECRVETRTRGSGFDSPSVECQGVLGCRNAGRYMRVVMDIADNRVVAWHASTASGNLPETDQAVSGARTYLPSVLLFSDGQRLLRQQETWIPVSHRPNVVKSMPGPFLRTVDTSTGQVANENPRAPAGSVSRVFCRGVAERTVIAGGRKVHLIDLNTLEPIATSPIPFDRPFVF